MDGGPFLGGGVPNTQEDASAPTPGRYVKQNRSAHGKVAYVIFAGHDVGVFYNWYVFIPNHEIYQLNSN